MKGSVLEVSGLTGGYQEKEVFRNIDLAVKAGEVVGLIGPNGGGKTTLIRHLIGFLKPQGGSVKIDGIDLHGLGGKERGRQLAYVPQEVPGAFEYPLRELVAMGRYPYEGGFGSSNQPSQVLHGKESVQRALAYVGLESFAERPFTQLSGGEKHRGLFARALAQETPYLILDEPTANLDLGQEHMLFGMLRELAREGRGVLVALHNLTTAAEYCDRLLLLHQGELVAQGTPAEILTPENLRKYYQAPVTIGKNENTGSLLVLHNPLPPPPQGRSIHLIAGAGSGVNLTRHLVRRGYRVTGGVAHGWDSDSVLWESLGIDQVRVEPFSPITPEAYEAGAKLVEASQTTVLCDFPLGSGNALNLSLGERAKNLIVVIGEKPRQWFAPGLELRFQNLLKDPKVRQMTESQLVDLFSQDG